MAYKWNIAFNPGQTKQPEEVVFSRRTNKGTLTS